MSINIRSQIKSCWWREWEAIILPLNLLPWLTNRYVNEKLWIKF